METPMHTPHPLRRAAALAGLLSALAATTAQAQGVAWVSSEKDNALALVDLKTQAVTGTVATCKRPRHMQIAPDGKHLLVACGDSGQADLIDLASRKSVRKLALGDDPEIFDVSATARRCTSPTRKTPSWASSTWPAASALAPSRWAKSPRA